MTTKTLVFPLSVSFSLNKRMTAVVILGIMLSLIAVSIIQVNAYTREVYAINQYEKNLDQLKEDTSILEVSFSKASSLENLASHIENQIFVKADKIEYIRLFEGTAMAK